MRIDDPTPSPLFVARRRARYVALVVLVAFAAGLIWAPRAHAFDCVQLDGVEGWYDGTTADDKGCITTAEYEAMTSPPALVEAGVADSYIDHGDGTATVTLGGYNVLMTWSGLDRPLAATPRLDQSDERVRDYWFRPVWQR